MAMLWSRTGLTSAAILLLAVSSSSLASECPSLLKFAGVCTGMRLNEIRALKNVSISPRHGGRGCDTYHAKMTYADSTYDGVLDFSGGDKILAAYSLEISQRAADNLISALSQKYGAPNYSAASGGGSVVEKKWRVMSTEISIKKIPNEAWIQYYDFRYVCDSNSEY